MYSKMKKEEEESNEMEDKNVKSNHNDREK
jgi:hypothetical protein